MKNIYGFNQISLSKKQSGKSIVLFQLLLVVFLIATGVALYFTAPERSQFLQGDKNKQESSVAARIDAGKNTINSQGFRNHDEVIARQSLITTNHERVVDQLDDQHFAWVKSVQASLYSTNSNRQHAASLPSIAGRVLDDLGAPLAGIKILAKTRDYFEQRNEQTKSSYSFNSKSNADGFYAFKDMPQGTYLLRTNSNKRYLPKSIEVSTQSHNADIILTEIETIDLSGKIIDESGNALSGVKITPVVKGFSQHHSSSKEGAFQFSVNIGDIKKIPLKLEKEGFRTKYESILIENWLLDQNLVLKLTAANAVGQLSGMLRGRANEDMSNYSIQLYSQGLFANYQVITNGAGEFSFLDIEPADDYRLIVRPKSEYKDYLITKLEIGERPLRQDIQLEALGKTYELSGQVLDYSGRPISNGLFLIRNLNSKSNITKLTTDEYGAYQVHGVPAGPIEIKSTSEPFYVFKDINLNGNDFSLYKELVLDKGEERLFGEIKDEDGKPVSAQQIYLTTEKTINGVRSQSSRTTSANIDGKFIFTDLGANNYTITLKVPGYSGVRLAHNLNQKKAIVVRLEKEIS